MDVLTHFRRKVFGLVKDTLAKDGTAVKKMTLREAIFQVLKEAGEPLSAAIIAERILEADLWVCKTKTPGASVGAVIYMDIKSKDDASRFVKVERGYFALRTHAESDVAEADLESKHPFVKVERGLFELRTHAESDVAEADLESKPPENKPLERMSELLAETYSFTECTQKVLEIFGDKKPMHYREITEKARDMGWLVTDGKTPEASLYAQVIGENERFKKRGERPRFVQHGRGYLSLSKWEKRGLPSQIEQHNKDVRKALAEQLSKMDPGEFEGLVGELLSAMGFEVEQTRLSGDNGIDVRGTLVVGDVIRIRMAVQVKRWKKNIQAPIVQQVRGSLGAHEQGLIITTSDFGKGAKGEAAQSDKVPIALMNGTELVALLMEHDIGVRRSTPDLFELNADFFARRCEDDLQA